MSTEIKPGIHRADRSEAERKEVFSLSEEELEEFVGSISLSVALRESTE